MNMIRGINNRYWKEGTGTHILILVYLGYWPLEPNETNRYLKFMRHFFPKFIIGVLTFSMCVALYDLKFKLNDYILLAESLSYIITLSKALILSIIAILKIEDIVQIFSFMEKFTRFINEVKGQHIFNISKQKSIRFTVIFIVLECIFGLAFTIQPLFEAERRYPMHYNLPLDSPMYEICYACAVTSGLVSCMVLSCSGSFIISGFIYFSGYLEILQYKLEHSRMICLKQLLDELNPRQAIGLHEIIASRALVERNTNYAMSLDMLLENVDEVTEAQERVVSELSSMAVQNDTRISLVSDADLQNRGICIESLEQVVGEFPTEMSEKSNAVVEVEIWPEMKPNVDTLNLEPVMSHHLASHAIDIESTEVELGHHAADQEAVVEPSVDKHDLEVAMRRHLVLCAKMHQDIIWVKDRTQDDINYSLCMSLVLGAVAICLTMFLTITVPFGSVEMFLWFVYLSMILAELYGFCWASSQLNEQSVKVSDALYFSDWTEASPSYKRSMLIMMSRAVRPLEISTMAFLTFDMEVFTNVLHSAYSYFNVMSKMHKTK